MTRGFARPLLLVAAALAPLGAPGADGEAPGGPGRVVAVRAPGPIRIDGVLDEEAWRAAPVFDGFVQDTPVEAGAPSQRTEVRVLYDDRYLLVGIECHDALAGEIVVAMGRRDAVPYSDRVTVLVDPGRRRHGALAFAVSSAGTQEDGVYYDDDQYAGEWDAPWDSAVARSAGGWSAELAIPLGVLQAEGVQPEWGFAVRRRIARANEVVSSVPFPAGARGIASRLGVLVGAPPLAGLADLSITPYAAARLLARPKYSDPSRPRPRLVDGSGDVGLDVRYALQDRLLLFGTVNPDFGQVEADQAIQNLTRFEVFTPEKRPFFLESLGLFQPVGAKPAPQQVFYSRRIGLGAPILAAVKGTAAVTPTLRVALLDAVVAGDGQPAGATEDDPPSGVRFLPHQPLHLAPLRTLPARRPAVENYLAAVARWHPDRATALGATFATVGALERSCSAGDAALPADGQPASCAAPGGAAGALHWDVRSGEGDWGVLGQLTGSQARDGAPSRTLADGTTLARGDLGYGGFARAGRLAGEGLRVELRGEYESPRLDVNATGFQRTQNQALAGLRLEHVRSVASAALLSRSVYVDAWSAWTTDARRLARGTGATAGFSLQLLALHVIGCSATVDGPAQDVREIGLGMAYARPPAASVACSLASSPSRPIALTLDLGGGRANLGAAPGQGWTLNGGAGVTVRPHPLVLSRVWFSAERSLQRARAIGVGEQGDLVFGDLEAGYLSISTRQQIGLTPRLSLHVYGQLFGEYGRGGPYYTASAAPRVSPSDLVRVDGPPGVADPSFHASLLNVNVVLRWDHAAGSSVFAVYSRTQRERPGPVGAAPPSDLGPVALGPGPVTDSFMLKWTYRIGR